VIFSHSCWTNSSRSRHYVYDAAGNLNTIPSIASYTYNGENQLVSTGGVTYNYDGDGRRVSKSSGKLYWYGTGADPLDETDLAGNTNNASFKEYIFFGANRIARRDSSNAVNYYFSDHLGTARSVANSTGTILDDSDFYPFGGERVVISSSGNTYKFTGKERDSESALNNFGARYNSSSMGRFMSPDPVYFQASMLTDPQRFNEYAYARNNPLLYLDPSGEAIELTGDEEQRKKELQALRDAVGAQAGAYLYENKVVTANSDGTTSTSYYVGIYTNGPSGNGPSFGEINSASKEIGGIIQDKQVVELDVRPAGSYVEDSTGGRARIAPIGDYGSPGYTYVGIDGKFHISMLDTSTTPPGSLPSNMMSNNQPGLIDAGIIIGHELGHLRAYWNAGLPSADSNTQALRLENKVRSLRNPVVTRSFHQNPDPPQ
jgi:RHS repeat-associated protein